MKKKTTILSLIVFLVVIGAAPFTTTFVDFNGIGNAGDPAPSISVDGVTVSFSNLEVSEIGYPSNGMGGGRRIGANQVVLEDRVHFNGHFLTALDFGRGRFRGPGFVRTIAFDMEVSDVSLYIADIDAGEGIVANALDGSGAVLATLVFPASLRLNGRVQLVDFGMLSGIRSVTLVGDDPVGIDNLSFTANPDSDGDGVLDVDDLCESTFSPESIVPTNKLASGRWSLGADGTFVTKSKSTKSKKSNKSSKTPVVFTIAETQGCSCEQILDRSSSKSSKSEKSSKSTKSDKSKKLPEEYRNGCKTKTIEAWILNPVSPRFGSPAHLTASVEQFKDIRFAGEELVGVPETYELTGNYPNPFNPQTTILFGVPQTAIVRLAVYDMLGREVKVLVNGTMSAGMHEATFDASSLPSGSYIYLLTTPENRVSKIMTLLK